MNIQIRELSIENKKLLKAAIQMMNRTQGEGLFKMNYLTDKISSKEALVLGAFIDAEIVGVGCAEIINEFSYYLDFDQEIVRRMGQHKVGSMCSLCVREDLQGRGIGQSLTKQRLLWLKNQGCHFAVGVSWKSGLAHTSDRVFKKSGFLLVKEVEDFYKSSSTKFPFDCPGCRSKPCTCSAAMYEYTFKS